MDGKGASAKIRHRGASRRWGVRQARALPRMQGKKNSVGWFPFYLTVEARTRTAIAVCGLQCHQATSKCCLRYDGHVRVQPRGASCTSSCARGCVVGSHRCSLHLHLVQLGCRYRASVPLRTGARATSCPRAPSSKEHLITVSHDSRHSPLSRRTANGGSWGRGRDNFIYSSYNLSTRSRTPPVDEMHKCLARIVQLSCTAL